MKELLEEVKKTTVFLGTISEEEGIKPSATGFLVALDGVLHLVTAKHVVKDPRTGNFLDSGMMVLFNKVGGGIAARSLDEVKEARGTKWLFHENDAVDIAIIPIPLNRDTDEVLVVPDNKFIGSDELLELYDVFYLSFQPGITVQHRITPIVRGGVISLVNDDRTFFIDGFAFPGNSGSPVFLKPAGAALGRAGIGIGGDKLGGKFIGLIGEYITYHEIAVSTQTRRPRVVFEENTGLSRVWSVDFIGHIQESDAFKQQIETLRNGGEPKTRNA